MWLGKNFEFEVGDGVLVVFESEVQVCLVWGFGDGLCVCAQCGKKWVKSGVEWWYHGRCVLVCHSLMMLILVWNISCSVFGSWNVIW